MPDSRPGDDNPLVAEFRAALEDCENLYRSCAQECVRSRSDLAEQAGRDFVRRMIDLHRGLVLKVFVTVAYVDRRWTAEELMLAAELLDHVWDRQLNEKQVKVALAHFMDQTGLTWDVLLGPFERLSTFRNWAPLLQTVVMRLANLVAKVDGRIEPKEVRQLKWIQAEMQRTLERVPLYSPDPKEAVPAAGQQALQQATLGVVPFSPQGEATPRKPAQTKPASPELLLETALAELDKLIGLTNIKHEVHGLVNFLKMQKARAEFDLPRTAISLHMAFSGNPGTGKTTVARLLGQIFGAMGILTRGHLIETDRSGLVAEYAGQTAPKAHKKIDEALDGVLFIDEAYSLVAEKGDDPYGAEALQVLLKRMEDNRDRFVVILAGYPQPLERLLRSNPGLSSRFSRHFHFPDYSASELGRIFESLSSKNRYVLPTLTRAKLLLGFQYLLDRRDEHFGNGRLARNVFEHAIRRLANRIAGIVPLTREVLTTLEPEDVVMEGVPPRLWDTLASGTRHFRVVCPLCRQADQVAQHQLGTILPCNHCRKSFAADWGEVVANE